MSDDALLAGRYRRVRELGRGAMGEVWLAEDLELDRHVAIKTMRVDARTDNPLALERVVREARVAARLRHRHTVAIYDLIREGDQPLVIMEYVEGESLAELLRRSGRLDIGAAARLIGQVADALDAAHRVGIVHRDIKPANILIDSAREARLADFGIARGTGDAVLTDTGQAMGTVAFMAPEVARDGIATSASDVWSLGATLYAAIEGRAPYQGDASSSAVQILTRLATEPVPPPANAGELAPLLLAMLASDPAARPMADSVARSLQMFVAASDAEATRRRPAGMVVSRTAAEPVYDAPLSPAMELTHRIPAAAVAEPPATPRETHQSRPAGAILSVLLVLLPVLGVPCLLIGLFGPLIWVYASVALNVAALAVWVLRLVRKQAFAR